MCPYENAMMFCSSLVAESLLNVEEGVAMHDSACGLVLVPGRQKD